MELLGIFRIIFQEFPVVGVTGLEVVDAGWMTRWNTFTLILASEPDVSGGSVVEFFRGLRDVAHVPEGVGLLGTAAVAIDPPGAVVVGAGSGSALSDGDAHWVASWSGIKFVFGSEPDISGGSVVELLGGCGHAAHVLESVGLLGSGAVAVDPPGSVVVRTSLGSVQTGLLLVVLLVVSVVMLLVASLHDSDAHWVTGWLGIVGVEATDL